MRLTISQRLFKEAKDILVGGVNSPVRSFKAVGGEPIFIRKAKGAKVYDEDRNSYIDYVGSFGPLILGHANTRVIVKIKRDLSHGLTFGASTKKEIELAHIIQDAFPSAERIRFTSSGTEACMTAIRLARGYTGRDAIVKFEGCYHGHSDSFLVKAGSGATTLGIPDSLGVPRDLAEKTINVPYNDLEALKRTLKERGKEISSVIVEPVAGNMGVVLPKQGFLEGLREITLKEGIVLIFDEVITGFRLSFGGAQTLFDIRPDLTCFGKIIGGGLPIGAVGGKRAIMELLAPLGPVYQAGTLSGNPIATRAGIETLKVLRSAKIYQALEKNSIALTNRIRKSASEFGIPLTLNQIGSIFTPFFTDKEVNDYKSATESNTDQYSRFFALLLKEGIYPPPSQFEAWFLSAAHRAEHIKNTIKGIRRAFSELASSTPSHT